MLQYKSFQPIAILYCLTKQTTREWIPTLASGIEVGQEINVEPGKFCKKNNVCMALNTHVLCSK